MRVRLAEGQIDHARDQNQGDGSPRHYYRYHTDHISPYHLYPSSGIYTVLWTKNGYILDVLKKDFILFILNPCKNLDSKSEKSYFKIYKIYCFLQGILRGSHIHITPSDQMLSRPEGFIAIGGPPEITGVSLDRHKGSHRDRVIPYTRYSHTNRGQSWGNIRLE